jgi:glycine/D-amino acid oxidase-like deaminating enzyme
VDVAVAGAGVPALAAALELSRRGSRVALAAADPPGQRARGLGLALLGCGRPYVRVAGALGRSEARLVWAAGCESHLRLRALLDEAGGCGYAPRGSFLLALDRVEAAELAESEDMLRDDGFPGEFLDHYMLETRFDVSGFPGAYWAAEDAELDEQALREALEARARAAGVAFLEGPVRSVDLAGGAVLVEAEEASARAATAVVATDGGASGLVPELRPLLGAAPAAGVRAPLAAEARVPSAARTADGRIAWRCIDGAMLLRESGPAREGFGERLLAFARRMPVDAAVPHRWEDAGEVTVDGLPLVGRLPGRPLAVACGFGAFSPGLAFAAARWVADALLKGTDPTPAALRPTRAPVAV